MTILLSAPFNSYADNSTKFKAKQIKNDPGMIWAEREAVDILTARQLAETDLLHKIQVSITVSTSAKQEEQIVGNSAKMTEDFTRQHESYSHLYLKGLDYIEIKQNKTYTVIAYISREALNESFNIQKNKIRSFTTASIAHAKYGRVGEALKNAYWGYLLSMTYPDSIHLNVTDGDATTNPQITLRNMIQQILSDIDLRFKQSYIDAGLLIVELGFTYNTMPISDLDFSYYSGMGMEYSPVIKGKAVIPLHDHPSEQSYPLTISLEYAYDSDMIDGSEIKQLFNTFHQNTFDNRKTVTLNLGEGSAMSSSNSNDMTKPNDTPEAIRALIEQRNWDQFSEMLEQYVSLGELRYGKRSDFSIAEGCFVAVIDQPNVKDLLSFDGKSYRSLRTNQKLLSPAERYKGCVQIWLREE